LVIDHQSTEEDPSRYTVPPTWTVSGYTTITAWGGGLGKAWIAFELVTVIIMATMMNGTTPNVGRSDDFLVICLEVRFAVGDINLVDALPKRFNEAKVNRLVILILAERCGDEVPQMRYG
jgi:hypothetical protein